MFEKVFNSLIYLIYLIIYYYLYEICLLCEYCFVYLLILREFNLILYFLCNNMFKLIRFLYKELGKLKCIY